MSNIKVLSLVHHDFEDLELWYPVYRLREEGVTVELAGEQTGEEYQGKHGVPAKADKNFKEIHANDYHAMLVPGGWAPDKLRRFPEVLSLVQEMDQAEKPIGQICHAGWVLISAGILSGREVTSTPGIKDDMMNAGGIWHDQAVVVDNNLVSSRRPPDLPEYMSSFVQILKKFQQ